MEDVDEGERASRGSSSLHQIPIAPAEESAASFDSVMAGRVQLPDLLSRMPGLAAPLRPFVAGRKAVTTVREVLERVAGWARGLAPEAAAPSRGSRGGGGGMARVV